MRAGGGGEGEEDWLFQVVLVTVKKAYYTPSIARIFSKLCFAFSVLKIKLLFLKLCFSKKKRKTSPNYTFIVITFFILGYILALKKHSQQLHLIPDQKRRLHVSVSITFLFDTILLPIKRELASKATGVVAENSPPLILVVEQSS